ncbi:hypothetical protein COV19_04550 [Candidatus Woesearchaeota archaeon CG10_big_fil_rev_8_21_14_0_10_44_13]|nr:MAG: hypothetical protein COV19_04550 [Candidatus Woesearchaeota archaeon CG10_big_fil_rev_8_21_14_0_10_44_13]
MGGIAETRDGVIFNGWIFDKRAVGPEELETSLSFEESRRKYYDDRLCPIFQRLNQSRSLYVSNKYKTRDHFRKMNFRDADRMKMEMMKGLIADESFPDHLVLGVDEDEYTVYGVYDFGRQWLVWLAGDLGFEQALHELREVMLHDLSYEMRHQAIESISQLSGDRIPSALCDKLNDKDEKIRLRELAANKLYMHPSQNSVRPLREAYEERAYVPTGHEGFGHELDVSQGDWMPNYCLRALGKISTLDALEGIKAGFSHPMEEVQHWAHIALDEWISLNAGLLASGQYKGNPKERGKLLKKLIFIYGCDAQKGFYDNVRF